MSEPPTSRVDPRRARSFDAVADAYDRARPSYPQAAVQWLTGTEPVKVVELGAGTGKLTEQLVAGGHLVIATDPSPAMLRRLAARAPKAWPVVAAAERIPLATGSADVVAAAQAFHWFDPERTLHEVARVLRRNGTLALAWNERDERIPWVRRLGEIVGDSAENTNPTQAIDDSGLFAAVESTRFRFWQPLTRASLRELVLSRSSVAVLPEAEREPVLARVDALYDEYGRGADGMLLPYHTCCYRARVLPWAQQPQPPTRPVATSPPDADPDPLLIDFR